MWQLRLSWVGPNKTLKKFLERWVLDSGTISVPFLNWSTDSTWNWIPLISRNKKKVYKIFFWNLKISSTTTCSWYIWRVRFLIFFFPRPIALRFCLGIFDKFHSERTTNELQRNEDDVHITSHLDLFTAYDMITKWLQVWLLYGYILRWVI